MCARIDSLKELIIRKKSLHEDVDELLVDEVSSLISNLESYKLDDIRYLISDLSHELHKHESLSISLLTSMVLNNINKIINAEQFQSSSNEIDNISDDGYMKNLEKCYNAFPDNEIRIFSKNLSSINIENELEFYNINAMLLNINISTPFIKDEIKEDISTRMMSLVISHHYSYKYNLQHEFYIQFASILSRMSVDGFPQLARDISEEALFCSYEKKEIYYGFYVKFVMYTSQKNTIDSLLSLLLFIAAFNSREISLDIKNKTLIEFFILLRDLNFFDLANDYYTEVVESLELEEFDRQKCQLAYFNLNIIGRNLAIVGDIKEYLNVKLNDILIFREGSIIPWYVMIHNMLQIFPENTERSYFLDVISKFESLLDTNITEQIKEKILGVSGNLKASLIDGLNKLSKTRNKDDYVYEVNSLIPLANKLIDFSIENKDVEGLLLAHKLKSDSSILFKGDLIESTNGVAKISPGEYEVSRLNLECYYNDVLSLVKDNMSYFWIGVNNGKLYALIQNGKDVLHFGYISSTTLNEFSEWIDVNITRMGFNENPSKDILISNESMWDDEKEYILKSLPSLEIDNFNLNKNIFIFPDVRMMGFPTNLIKINNRLLGSSHILSAPFSIENLVDDTISNSIYLWAPIKQNDLAIAMAYSALERNVNKSEVCCDTSERPSANSDINVFISHGGKDENVGFSGVSPAEGKTYKIDRLFGTGRIAILFICHSGSMVKNMYSNSNNTLITGLIESGYDAVISPSWSLHVSIPSIWLPEFITSLKVGMDVSEAVFNANKVVEKKFISPKASMAMHIFGNGALHF